MRQHVFSFKRDRTLSDYEDGKRSGLEFNKQVKDIFPNGVYTILHSFHRKATDSFYVVVEQTEEQQNFTIEQIVAFHIAKLERSNKPWWAKILQSLGFKREL